MGCATGFCEVMQPVEHLGSRWMKAELRYRHTQVKPPRLIIFIHINTYFDIERVVMVYNPLEL